MEAHARPQRRATLELTTTLQFMHEQALRAKISNAGIKTPSTSVIYQQEEKRRRSTYEVEWRPRKKDVYPPAVLERLVEDKDVLEVKWSPRG